MIAQSDSCRKKKFFTSRTGAQKYKKKMQNKLNKSFRVYRCNICEFFHLASRKIDEEIS